MILETKEMPQLSGSWRSRTVRVGKRSTIHESFHPAAQSYYTTRRTYLQEWIFSHGRRLSWRGQFIVFKLLDEEDSFV